MQVIAQANSPPKPAPSLPSSNGRYDRLQPNKQPTLSLIKPKTFVHRGNLSEPTEQQYINSSYRKYVHPEGDVYYYNKDQRFVTSSNPQLPSGSQGLEAAYRRVMSLFGESGALPPSSELWLDWNARMPFQVGYYLVNHEEQVVYWPEAVDTARLGLGSFESDVELRAALTAEYWVHVDYFPCHRDVDVEAERALLSTLRNGCIDNLTAPGSTFPWGAEECRDFLTIIEGFKDNSPTENVAERMCCIARLWTAIARVRQINGYGTENARLDRFQGLEEYTKSQLSWSLRLAIGDAVTLGQSRHLFQQLTELWNGRVVYQRHWKTFFDGIREEWKQVTYSALAVWMACVILVASGKAQMMVFISACLSALAILLSMQLQQTHAVDRLSSAQSISMWISQVEDFKHGLRPLSIKFALPRALTVGAFLSLQLGMMLSYKGAV